MLATVFHLEQRNGIPQLKTDTQLGNILLLFVRIFDDIAYTINTRYRNSYYAVGTFAGIHIYRNYGSTFASSVTKDTLTVLRGKSSILRVYQIKIDFAKHGYRCCIRPSRLKPGCSA
jgi:hypothetical protein